MYRKSANGHRILLSKDTDIMKDFVRSRAGRIISSIVIGLVGSLACEPAQATTAWTIGAPITTFFVGPALSDANAGQMYAGGFNLVRADSLAEMDMAYRWGLRAMWTGPLDDYWIPLVRNYSNLYAYYVPQDEPSAALFPSLAATVAHVRSLDPDHVAYINLNACYASPSDLGASDYRAYVSQYMSIVKPSLLSYDNYQFTTTGDRPDYFKNLSLISHTAKQAGIPFMNIVQASSWDSSVLVPTGNQLRYLYYTSLAYGAQGVSNYVYWWPRHTGGMALSDGTTTPLYTTVSAINPQFVAIGKQLQSLHHIGAYHMGDLPPGYGTTDGSSPMRLPSGSPFWLSPTLANTNYVTNHPVRGMLLGIFGPDDQLAHATFTLVTNLNYVSSVTTTVNGPGNLSVFNATTGLWSPTGHNYATLTLEPGGGILVGLTAMVPEPGTLTLLMTALAALLAHAWRNWNV
jgi:hypothetical protein